MARKVKVAWTTREVNYWEAELDVPDDVPDEEVEDYFTDGDCPTLIEYEDWVSENGGRSLDEFTREIESFGWAEAQSGQPKQGGAG